MIKGALRTTANILSRPLNKGKLINERYEIMEFLGRGSYGNSYLVFDREKRSHVVLKLLRKHKMIFKAVMNSFKQEQEILQFLNYCHFPAFYEKGEFRGTPFYTMEFVNGKTFEQLIFQERKTFSEKESFQVGNQLLLIMDWLHHKKIVHRDIRIPNVMIEGNQIKLIDFGLARRFDAPAGCTRAPSRCSISAASPTGSWRRGRSCRSQGFAGIPLDISDFPTRHNYGLALWQSDFEPILAGWVAELGVPILRGREVVGLAQDDTGVDVELSDGTSLRAEYLVGCDGGRSLVRKAAGIDFAGLDPSTSWMIAEVEMDEEPELGFRRDGGGIGPVGRAEGGGPYRGRAHRTAGRTHRRAELGRASRGARRRVRDGLRAAPRQLDLPVHRHDAAGGRPTAQGRVLLAGDAAHVHPPQGGQGLNIGVQDAVNLGWKLAQVVDETSPESLLDTYHAERHPVGARVLRNTMAQVALSSPDDRHQALRDTMTELLSMDEPRRRIAAMLSGLDIHYDLGEGHPLLGRRMPDLDVHTADGPTRVFTLLHDARPVLLDLGEPGGFDISPWANRVRLVDARHDGVWELPVLGEVAAPAAVLIRPDGHVAWAGDLTDPELPRLATWFGAGAPDPAPAR